MRRLTRLLSLFLLSSAVSGCVARKVASAPDLGVEANERFVRDDQPESLFKGDSTVLSDGDIVRILGVQLNLSGPHRLAVLKLHRAGYWWQGDPENEAESVSTFLDRLRSGDLVSEAQALPLLLVPEKKTVPYLREAGARFQADLLLVYNTNIRTFEKSRALGRDEVRTRCTVESIILHVPTGIVPFSARATEEVHAVRKSDDLNFSETVAKAVAAAERNALMRIADDTLRFLRKARGT